MPQSPASPAHRRYRCRDGDLQLQCQTEEQWRALARALGRPELAYPGSWEVVAGLPLDGRLAQLLETLLAEETVANWQRRFKTAGVPYS